MFDESLSGVISAYTLVISPCRQSLTEVGICASSFGELTLLIINTIVPCTDCEVFEATVPTHWLLMQLKFSRSYRDSVDARLKLS